jgi:hypothetical protein
MLAPSPRRPRRAWNRPLPRRRLLASLAALAGGAGLLAVTATVGSRREQGPLPQGAYVWQRAWGPAVAGAVRAAGADFSALVALGAEVRWREGKALIDRVSFDGQSLAAAGVAVGLGLRVHEPPGDAALAAAIGPIGDEIAAMKARAEASGARVGEIQIDLDCPTSRLDAYARWVEALRPRTGGARLVVTALPSWLGARGFEHLARAVDGYVLQVHGLERPVRADSPLSLLERGAARRAIEKAGAIGAPFVVALPTYEHELAFGPDGALVGLASEGPAARWPEGTTLRRVGADAAEVAALVREIEASRPAALRGLLWYRLPVAGDARNWRLVTLRRVMRGEAPAGHVVARVATEEPGLWRVTLANEGSGDADAPGQLRLRWTGGSRVASDGLGGFQAREGEAEGLLLEGPALRLRPGERREIAWIRLDTVNGQVTADEG